MITVEIDEAALQPLQQRLSGLAPRFLLQLQQRLRSQLYLSLQTILQKYFSGSGPGGPAASVLTSRSGNLLNSVLASLQTTVDGAGLKISIGSNLPYAAIHEYGGYAGRHGPFKKKNGRRPYLRPRPYLHPAINDLEQLLPDLFDQAMQEVLKAQ